MQDPLRPAPTTTLVVAVGGEEIRLNPGQSAVVGRGGQIGHRIEDPRVSRRHLEIVFVGDRWQLTDVSSSGTYLDGRRIPGCAVGGTSVRLRLGAPDGVEVSIGPVSPASASAPPPASPAPASRPPIAPPAPSALHRIETGRVSIGRAPDNDVVVEDLLASRRHATLTQTPAGWLLSDLNSHNGTFVNGTRIQRLIIGPDDVVSIGHRRFRLTGGRLAEYLDTGDITFEARELSVVIGGKTLLDGVSFFLPPRSLLAVIGPSGSGKSTLLKALTGIRPADRGGVGYGGRDLYANYDELRARIGLVPQDDILHTQLQVRTALGYSARLRFPQDVSEIERERRIDTVLADLGLGDQHDQRIDTLSGGQRKRTSTALELLTQPSLLFLDEPTSGLDSGWDKSVMTKLRELADDGRTVIVVSHSVAHLDVCDRLLVLAPGGRVAYFGPPGEALAYFGADDHADMYTMLERERSVDWADRFRRSPQYREYVVEAAGAGQAAPPPPPPSAATAQQTPLSQFTTLCRRYLAVIAADRQFVILMTALPLLLALFAHAVPAHHGLSILNPHDPGRPDRSGVQLLLVLVLGGCLIGSTASVREIVKERPIYERERSIGLSPVAYLASKIAVLSVLTGAQALLLVVLGLLGSQGPDDGALLPSGTLEVIAAVIATTLAAMTIGLILSAVVRNADRTMPLLVVLIMAQLLLSGGLFPVNGRPLLAQFSWLMPARWGFAAGASTMDLNALPSDSPPDPLWRHSGGVWIADIVALGVLIVVGAGVAALLVNRIGRPKRVR